MLRAYRRPMTSAFVPQPRAAIARVREVEPGARTPVEPIPARRLAPAAPSRMVPAAPPHDAVKMAAARPVVAPGAFVPVIRRAIHPSARHGQGVDTHPDPGGVPGVIAAGVVPSPEAGARQLATTFAVRSRTPLAEAPPRVWREELGPLAPFAADPAVTDLFVNGARGLFVDRGQGAMHEPSWHADEAEVLALATALIARGGRHVDQASPCVDVRLADGARVHAVLPPVARHGTTLSVRVPRLGSPSLAALAERGMFGHDDAVLAWLAEQVHARTNLLIAGAAGAGKTTLLAALLAEAPASDRIVTIEDVAELRFEHPHHVSLEARQPNIEGAGEIGLARLVREALRMRPDRLVVGECRGAEVRELLSALNTGHAGGAGTLHANGLADVPARLEALGALAGMTEQALARQAISAIGFVLHVARGASGHALTGVGTLAITGGRLSVKEVRPWQC